MGERFGSYDLIEKIAVGGMAEIFKARAIHGRGVEKQVCIKRIHPALSADKDVVGMVIDEARLGVTMVHGNIVPVFDFGCIDGRYYLALEYVEGQDLAALHGRARVVGIEWPLELAVHVVAEVLEGLVYAHRKRDSQGRPLQLVHRDVSPSNILVSKDGQVKLLDFGIARSAVREFETRTGVIKGKPGYMSPEQAAGWAVDSRADVWSCGAVLHELVAGTKLKDGRVRIADAEVDAIVCKALSASLDDRYADTAEMQRALFGLLDGRGQHPRPGDLAAFIERVQAARAPGRPRAARGGGKPRPDRGDRRGGLGAGRDPDRRGPGNRGGRHHPAADRGR
jgi:serine/threonine protein kinase